MQNHVSEVQVITKCEDLKFCNAEGMDCTDGSCIQGPGSGCIEANRGWSHSAHPRQGRNSVYSVLD